MSKQILILFAIFLIAVPAFAQDRDDAVAIGVRGGATYYMGDDFDDAVLNPTFTAFGEQYLTNQLSFELGFNVSRISGETGPVDFVSHLTGLSLLGRLGLFDSFIRPYLAGGVQLFAYDPEIDKEASVAFQRDENEVTVGFPVGGGFNIGLGNGLGLDFRGLYHFTLRDGLDYAKGGSKDSYLTGTVGLTKLFYSNTDKDNDGLLRSDEKAKGTDPNVADTDGDGLKDGEEVLTYFTNPLLADTDKDGIVDSDEVLKYKSNPLKADGDGDGLSDGDEVMKYKTNPVAADTDGDGLNDSQELMQYKTNPLKADTDGDGLSDNSEISQLKTDPLKADSDGDGLSDGDEVNKYKTLPLVADSDSGSINDGAEVKRGTNPLSNSDDVILEVEAVGAKIVLEGIIFETGKALVSPKSEEILEKAFNTLKAYPEMEVEIQGYTDNVGKQASNVKLSQRRADAVRTYLINKGVEAKRIVARGYGPANPIASNDTAEGRTQNRRIEFVRTK